MHYREEKDGRDLISGGKSSRWTMITASRCSCNLHVIEQNIMRKICIHKMKTIAKPLFKDK